MVRPPRHLPEVTGTAVTDGVLPTWTRPLAVVAHPDDESFGLGALLSAFADAGGDVAVLCFTRGEASTLQAVEGNLATIRAAELESAAQQLGVTTVQLLDEPDGLLDVADRGRLVASVLAAAARHRTDGLLVFDDTGITGHPDHIAATRAALEAARSTGLPVLGWTLPERVAAALRSDVGAPFLGRPDAVIDLVVEVDRAKQLLALHAHASQVVPSGPLWRRLELLADREYLRWLARPAAGFSADR